MVQQAPPLSVEFQDFLNNAQALEFSAIAYQLTESPSGLQWSREKAVKTIAHYLAFLYLANHYPRLHLVPTPEIDYVWHCHILDTSQYAKDCLHLFGRYVHHFPYLESSRQTDQRRLLQSYALTKVLYHIHFGIRLEDYTSPPADGKPCGHLSLHRDTLSCGALTDAWSLSSSEIQLRRSHYRPAVEMAIAEVLKYLPHQP